jgi:hypothetical protein
MDRDIGQNRRIDSEIIIGEKVMFIRVDVYTDSDRNGSRLQRERERKEQKGRKGKKGRSKGK